MPRRESPHIDPETSRSARRRPSPVDCRTRLLLDPYLCVGPGSEAHAGTLFDISQHCAALGITLCVDGQAWSDAERDPDVLRRQVDLTRFEPIVRLDIPAPAHEGGAWESLSLRAHSETDVADLKLVGALRARQVQYLLALDGRVHALAARAGLASSVLTPADALDWLLTLGGSGRPVTLREVDPRSAIRPGPLRDLIDEECEPYDPYLRGRLAAGRGRTLVALADDEPLGLGVLQTGTRGDRLELVALAARETARGARVFEPILSAALGMARRRGLSLLVLMPPHEEVALRLLEHVGFQRAGADPAGREQWIHPVEPILPRPAAGSAAWVLPLDAAAHERLLPEMSGVSQAQLFEPQVDIQPQAPGGRLRRQFILPAARPPPAPGDLVLFFHGRSPERSASASLTCLARVERALGCSLPEEVLAVNAPRPGYSLAAIRSLVADGPVVALDVAMLGRLERFLPLAWLRDLQVLESAPARLEPLPTDAWERIAGRLFLN
jgi:GNAT superfamily N-acetyltransferase